MSGPLHEVEAVRITSGGATATCRVLPEETPIALVYDGTTHAVMMATPADLEDFAVGFSLGEGQIESLSEIAELSVVEQEKGVELRMWLSPQAGRRVAARRRAMIGPTGCGLCGVDSLEAALPELPEVASRTAFSAEQVAEAVASLAPAQVLNQQSRALHAAGFWTPEAGLVVVREDVGRHNALDKLVGALTRGGIDPSAGIVVLTSRVSIEMVQKAANLGAPVIAAVSAPTALALRTADAAGITLAGIARSDAFEVFTHAHRIVAKSANEGRTRKDTRLHAAV